jgi:hypothetical protein
VSKRIPVEPQTSVEIGNRDRHGINIAEKRQWAISHNVEANLAP